MGVPGRAIALAVAMEHDLPVLRMQHVYGVVNSQLERVFNKSPIQLSLFDFDLAK
jgi:hypothetical protein